MDDPATTPAPASAPQPSSMKKKAAAWLKFALRWGIAVVGIGWVVSQMSIWDKVLVATPNAPHAVQQFTLRDVDATDYQPTFRVVGLEQPIPRDRVLNKPAKKNEKVEVRDQGSGKVVTAALLGLDLEQDAKGNPTVEHLYVLPPGGRAEFITPAQLVAGHYVVKVPYPRVDVGVARLIRQASQQNLWLLIIAIVIFPTTFILTSYRWHELLKALSIHIGLMRTFTLNMVGAFYNTFMPGSTGGDVLKALYVSRQTPLRTFAVMSVFIDRIIGLLALIIIGGIAAATQWRMPQCRHIAIVSFAIVLGTALGLLVFYQPTLHRLFGLDWIIGRMPFQKQVRHAVEVMMIYRREPGLLLWSLLVTFPVHVTVIVSAACSGKAFGLPLHWAYYGAIVPVIVLVGSLPISPQGAGVMEYFAIKLTETRGATVSQAFALTMSIRIVQILWNVTGVYFVVRGHFHAPTAAERKEVEEDLEGVPEVA
jgi:uncharacterized protein (TIRG00374 family)